MKKKIILILLSCMIIVVGVLSTPRLTEETVDVFVNKTFVKGDMYLAYTDKDTYEFDDSLAYLQFFPDELWGRVKSNTCYTFTTVGYRIKLPFKVNIYENVVDVKEISCKLNTQTK